MKVAKEERKEAYQEGKPWKESIRRKKETEGGKRRKWKNQKIRKSQKIKKCQKN